MRSVLATQLDISPTEADYRGTARGVARLTLDWCAGWYSRKGIVAHVPEIDGGTASPAAGHQIDVEGAFEQPTDGDWALSWRYPADQDPTALWAVTVRVLWDGVGVETSVSLTITSCDFAIRPFIYDVYPPRIIRTIADSYACSLGGRPLRSAPQLLSLQGVDAFVEHTLCNAGRRLPIILVSRDQRTNLFLDDPTRLARDLCGLAEVWAINDKWTSFRLSDALGKRLSCFDGAIRTYWPGFAMSSDPLAHPLLFPNRVRALVQQSQSVARYLIRHIAPVSALRFVESPRRVKRTQAAEEARRALLEERAKSIAASADVPEIEAQLFDAYAKQYELETELQAARSKASDLAAELAAVRENFAVVAAAARQEQEELEEENDAAEHHEPTSVREALDKAAAEFPVLDVWQSAREAADESHYARPEHVFRALTALADIAQLRQDQMKSRKPIGKLETLFEERGFSYTPTDSQTTITQYGKDRTFMESGRKLRFERHITLGGGDRQNCVQIYFEFDDERGQVLLGYCGVHLPYAGMRS